MLYVVRRPVLSPGVLWGIVRGMSKLTLSLTVTLAALMFAPAAFAQIPQDPINGMIGTATNVAGGVLGNSPSGTTSSGSSRSRSRTPALGTPLPANAPRQLIRIQADGYMNLPLETFQSMKRLSPPPFDWTSDGCSFGEISGPFRDSFNRACDRHDFGYRNYGGGGRLRLENTEARRTRIDDRLRDDLNGICRRDHSGLTETPCLALAQAIYAAARSQGRSWFTTGTGRPMQLPTPSVPGFNNGANQGPIPGLPIPGPGSSGNSGGNGLPIPGMGGGNSGLPLPIPNPQQAGQVLTAPTQVLGGGR